MTNTEWITELDRIMRIIKADQTIGLVDQTTYILSAINILESIDEFVFVDDNKNLIFEIAESFDQYDVSRRNFLIDCRKYHHDEMKSNLDNIKRCVNDLYRRVAIAANGDTVSAEIAIGIRSYDKNIAADVNASYFDDYHDTGLPVVEFAIFGISGSFTYEETFLESLKEYLLDAAGVHSAIISDSQSPEDWFLCRRFLGATTYDDSNVDQWKDRVIKAFDAWKRGD